MQDSGRVRLSFCSLVMTVGKRLEMRGSSSMVEDLSHKVGPVISEYFANVIIFVHPYSNGVLDAENFVLSSSGVELPLEIFSFCVS